MEDIYFSMVRYQNGKAIEISVNWGLRDDVKVSLYGLDVFNTPAEDVIRFMKQIGPCIHDEPDEQLSTEYEFPALGIRFWRERAFHESCSRTARMWRQCSWSSKRRNDICISILLL